ncbi:MAG: hypothetical protein U0790_10290 [Isosphaeraceae bacterium]
MLRQRIGEWRAKRRGIPASTTLWLVLSALLLLLDINKQSRLQTSFGSSVRQKARDQGWYSGTLTS